VIPVVTPDGVGERGDYPGSYRLLAIGDGETALFWVEESVDA
jgi:hypothetical protein